ncbi:prephenate dehydrogenase [Spirochaetota bacterium]|nr:prephenate dehydrogenase [Spirochaetota bacterium]
MDIRADARKQSSPCVAIIGGAGEMGRVFAKIFMPVAKTILIADKDTELVPKQAVKQADIVILAVPMEQTLIMIKQLMPLMKDGSLFMDITSLKKEETEAMVAFSPSARVEILGTHPLFGPYLDIEGQIIALTPIRGEYWFPYVKEIFTKAGLIPIVTSPAEHDQVMSVVQALLHVVLLSLLGTVQSLAFDAKLFNVVSTPLYKIVWMLASRIVSHDSNLYKNIAVANTYSVETLRTFQRVFNQFLNDIETTNGSQFEERFRSLKAYITKSAAQDTLKMPVKSTKTTTPHDLTSESQSAAQNTINSSMMTHSKKNLDKDASQPPIIPDQSQQLIDFFSKTYMDTRLLRELSNKAIWKNSFKDDTK